MVIFHSCGILPEGSANLAKPLRRDIDMMAGRRSPCGTEPALKREARQKEEQRPLVMQEVGGVAPRNPYRKHVWVAKRFVLSALDIELYVFQKIYIYISIYLYIYLFQHA